MRRKKKRWELLTELTQKRDRKRTIRTQAFLLQTYESKEYILWVWLPLIGAGGAGGCHKACKMHYKLRHVFSSPKKKKNKQNLRQFDPGRRPC